MLAFFNNNNLSGTIRANQPAEYLNRPINPPNLDEYTCIFVKQQPNEKWPDNSYLDILDGMDLRYAMQENPRLRAIAFTKPSLAHLAKFLRRDDLVYIPQHHCNYDRELRPQREVRVVGFVGSPTSLSYGGYAKRSQHPETFIKPFADAGFEFRYLLINKRSQREQVVDFYRQIDIQVYARFVRFTFHRFKDGLKLINAGSFGIPSVAKPELNDLTKYMIPAESLEEMIAQCVYLRDNPAYYEDVAQNLIIISESYHIGNIAPLFLQLEQ